ncbi:ras-related protein Rab-23-like [Limulus polyphemus]|uniref:Ras-related protein Rab-23-like n=1 Tax=Limulus polyphemus TaxID=6850 RepID=A0ABM1SKC3_LIMPO|nr:ras-related protein Rab-23-like [Limulus polyphemus]
MKEIDFETAIKVVIVGNGAVGKSSMIQKYCKGIFTTEYKKTIGVDFLERQIEVDSEDVRMMLWDTAGQEEFDAITKAYYRGAQAGVLVFSSLDLDSFKAIETWKQKVENECGVIPMVIVQNKIDMIHESVIASKEVENLTRKLRVPIYRTSVKENVNVNEVFHYLAKQYLKQVQAFEDVHLQQSRYFEQKPTGSMIKLSDLQIPGLASDSTHLYFHRPKWIRQRKKLNIRKCRIL